MATVFAHPIAVERFDIIGGIGRHAVDDGGLGAEKLLEVCDVVGGELGKVGVALDVGIGIARELDLLVGS